MLLRLYRSILLVYFRRINQEFLFEKKAFWIERDDPKTRQKIIMSFSSLNVVIEFKSEAKQYY